MDTLRQDLVYAIRRLGRTPGFTFIAVLTLALGIGANTAIFGIVYGVLLKPLPYPEPDRLVRLYQTFEGRRSVFSPPNFLDVQRRARTLESIAAMDEAGFTISRDGDSVRVEGAYISASLFDVLKVRPEIGRPFRAEEHRTGSARVVVLSHGYWLRRFGGDSGAVGQTLVVDNRPHEIVGVMPPGFDILPNRDIWVPFEHDEHFADKNRGAWYLFAIGRLAPVVTVDQAAGELSTIAAELERQYPRHNARVGMTADSLHGTMVQPIRPALLVLLGAVGVVLIIACVNVANLLLARAAARHTELAVRTALGAGRRRLVRQLFTESVLLATLGGIAGLLLAAWLTDLLVAAQPAEIPRLGEVGLNRLVVAFTAAVALLTALLFGLVPAFQVTRGNLAGSLKEGGRGTDAQARSARLRSILVTGEVALALTLLVGAGLLIRSFAQLTSVDPGFETRQAMTFRVAVPAEGEEARARLAPVYARLMESLRAIPGVTAVGASMALPLTNFNFEISFNVTGRPERPPGEQESLEVRVVTPGYFEAIGLPLRRGRLLTDADTKEAQRVLLLSESAARQHFPGEEAIGRTIVLGWRSGGERLQGEVVGIVADVKEHALSEDAPPEVYAPHAQWPIGSMQVIARTSVPPETVADALAARTREIEPRAPVYQMRTLEDILGRSVAEPRFYMILLGGFAAVALILATVGIFGVMSYAVTQRTREIGIRMALGAKPREVVAMVLRQASLLIGAGIALGIALSLALSRSMRQMLFELSPTDPATLASVAILLALVALLAGYLPARRATRVDPLIALRSE